MAWDIPEDHDPEDLASAYDIVNEGGVPLGVIYRDGGRMTFDARIEEMARGAKVRSAQQMVDSYAI